MSRIDNFKSPFEKMFSLITNDVTSLQINENNEKILKLIDNYGEISFDENIIESILSN